MAGRVKFAAPGLEERYAHLAGGDAAERDLHKHIATAIAWLREDPFCGIQVQKRLIPKEYGVKNLWKLNLPRGWRQLYTVEVGTVMIVSIILEWMDHKEYEQRFRY